MSRSVRFFEILQILRQAQNPVTAQTLADTLEVNIRTIYRDIASLQASKLPIEGEAGIGYIMRKGFDLPPLMFSQEELDAIVVGLSLLGRTGDRGLMKAAESVSSKVSTVLPSQSSLSKPLQVSQWNQIPLSNIQPDTIRNYIRTETEIEISYLNLHQTPTIRVIQPIALVYYIDVIVLVAWCKLRNAFRHFRLDKIQRSKETGVRFSNQAEELRKNWETLQKH